MKSIQYIAVIASLLIVSNIQAQNCPYDNTFYVDLTPADPGATATDVCIWAGDRITVSVILGETYIFSTCATISLDVTMTLYNTLGTVILATDDDDCGSVGGPATITWVATFTGVANLLIDEYPCVHATNCIELSVTWELPLPIELLNFDLEVFDNKVQLNWQTASEINNDFFTIERSIDGINWEAVNEVDGAGNSTSLLAYVSLDEKPNFGISYYRLKQTDFDGNFSFSEVRSVNIQILKNQNSLEIYPNPAQNQITITGSETELDQLKICDILGVNIIDLTKFTSNNGSKLVIDLSNLNTGMYYIKTKTTTNKVYKQ